jgi:hypothetical protein
MGVIFDSIPMAYDIIQLQYVRHVSDGQLLTMMAHKNSELLRVFIDLNPSRRAFFCDIALLDLELFLLLLLFIDLLLFLF